MSGSRTWARLLTPGPAAVAFERLVSKATWGTERSAGRIGQPIFVELKSSRGVASETQKQVSAELIPAGAEWWMARSARAAMMALQLSGVVFCRPWEPPQFEPWEGPFPDATVRLPQASEVAAQRRAAQRAWRLRHANCARETAKRNEAAGGNIAAL